MCKGVENEIFCVDRENYLVECDVILEYVCVVFFLMSGGCFEVYRSSDIRRVIRVLVVVVVE